jgi:hypothetical protein
MSTQSEKGMSKSTEPRANPQQAVAEDTLDPSPSTSHRQQLPTTTRVKGSRYTQEQRELGLRAVALASGNTERAAQSLRTLGIRVQRTTLRDWATRQHVQRYREIQAEVIPEIHARIAEQSDALALQAGETEAALITRLQKELPNVPARDLSRAVRDVATSRKISVEKGVTLRSEEKPAESNPIQDFTEAMKELKAMGLIPDAPRRVINLEEIDED